MEKLYISRVKRILPLYLFAFLFVFLFTLFNVDLSSLNLSSFLKWILDWLLFKGGSFENFPSGLVIAGVQWTLIYEWKFYFVLPVVFLIWHKKLSQWFSWILILVAIVYIFKQKGHHLYALFFLSIPAIVYKNKINRFIRDQLALTHAIIGFLSIFAFFFTEAYSWLQMFSLAIIFAFIISGYSFGVLNHTGLRMLGEISYSIYLLHGLVLYLLFSVIGVVNFKIISLTEYYLWFFLAALCTTIFSLFTYRFIERPFLAKKS